MTAFVDNNFAGIDVLAAERRRADTDYFRAVAYAAIDRFNRGRCVWEFYRHFYLVSGRFIA
ncbi:MAG: hypothetical protein GY789_09500 [Hyphomicrobiales bacterium]|nr:hypothetical protein [Hyphomicrobiales bacterium]MCP4998650.1 hypothetical protein [Hyphomicrobiales bacterium]